MMNDSITVEDVLSVDEMDELAAYLGENDFYPYPIDDGVEMYVCNIPQDIKNAIVCEVSHHVGQVVEEIAIYARYNSPNVDTSFRIHSDGLIAGKKVDLAAVLYCTTGNTGTALFTHPIHGSKSEGKIFTEDDGQWELDEYSEEKENTMFIYDAKRFHSRWPHQAMGERVVIVSFLKYKEYV